MSNLTIIERTRANTLPTVLVQTISAVRDNDHLDEIPFKRANQRLRDAYMQATREPEWASETQHTAGSWDPFEMWNEQLLTAMSMMLGLPSNRKEDSTQSQTNLTSASGSEGQEDNAALEEKGGDDSDGTEEGDDDGDGDGDGDTTAHDGDESDTTQHSEDEFGPYKGDDGRHTKSP